MNPSVTIAENPGAVVNFSLGQSGGLVTKLVFDGRPPEYPDCLPTAAGFDELADYILEKIAGVGGRGAEPT